MPDTTCPHCSNTVGFTFGTCTQCGYNYLSKEFTWIRVNIVDLDWYVNSEALSQLIALHKIRSQWETSHGEQC